MKRNRWVVPYQLFLSTVLFLIAATILVTAQSGSNQQFVVLATVLPERSIVVDKDLTIQQIYSNTKEAVRPNVYQGRIDGPQVAYGDSIREQYEKLRSSLDFSKPGLIYERPKSSSNSAYKTIINFFKRLLGF